MNKPASTTLVYPHVTGGRDLRLDFLRGLIMLVVITVHMEYYSLLSMFAWGRVGMASSAEGFVGLSGIVLGIVYKKRLLREGYKNAAIKLWQRSFQLYRVSLFVTLSILFLGMIPLVDIFEVSHWVPIGNKGQEGYSLYPLPTDTWPEIIRQTLLLKIGPHQFQIIGLYVVLIAFSPVVLYALNKQKTFWLLTASWVVYLINTQNHFRVSGARFEWGFPSLSWQLLFVNGMVIGFHSEKVLGYITNKDNKFLIYFSAIVCLGFLFIASNDPAPVFWPWKSMLSFIDAKFFQDMYMAFFLKSLLGLGRVFNNMALFIIAYYLLTNYWSPINKTLGWLFVPLGQASLYVFFVHVYFVLLASNTPLNEYNNFYLNTVVHVTTILIIWAMVKQKILFQIIPR